jgi:hypothetical protein
MQLVSDSRIEVQMAELRSRTGQHGIAVGSGWVSLSDWLTGMNRLPAAPAFCAH